MGRPGLLGDLSARVVTDRLTVSVSPREVRICDLRGERFEAEIFLHEAGDRRPGPETLEDRLNDPQTRFMPCRIDDEVHLLHLDRIAWVEEDGTSPRAAEMLEMDAARTPVELTLTFGEVVRGDLVYLLPEARRRPSDALNLSGDPFLLLVTPESTRYVHRAAVLRVRFP